MLYVFEVQSEARLNEGQYNFNGASNLTLAWLFTAKMNWYGHLNSLLRNNTKGQTSLISFRCRHPTEKERL